jgi:hypothetical protein
LWLQDFDNDVKAGTVPALSILWIIVDHTGGPPTAHAEQADNDLAVGRMIDYISHSMRGPRRRSSSRKTTRGTASTTSAVTAARAMSSARMWYRTGRPTTPTTRRSTGTAEAAAQSS